MSEMTPENTTPSMAIQIVGGKQLKDAAEVFSRATDKTVQTNKQLSDKLTQLNSALERLSRTLESLKGLGGGRTGSTRSGGSHNYGPLGGGATFSGVAMGGSGRAQQPQPIGGGASFSGFHSGGFGGGSPKTPNGGWRPSGFGQFGAGLFGMSHRSIGLNRPTALFALGEGTRQFISGAISRGVAQMDDQLMLDLIGAYERQRGIDRLRGLSLRFGVLGAENRSGQWVGEGARASVQSVGDAAQGNLLTLGYSGSGTYAFSRISSVQRAADAFGFANPGVGWSQSMKFVTGMLRPSNRLNMMLLGLPDPTAPDGSYRGNANFFRAFLKRIYQNREAVPPDVFEDDFREGGVGLENLRMVVGEEGAQLMLEPLRKYNEAKFLGKNVSDFDQVMSGANIVGSEGDRWREIAQRKYGFEPTVYQEEQRIEAKSRASQLAGHDEFIEAYEAGARSAELFSDAVHEFVNAPFIKEVKNWTEAFFGRFLGGNTSGLQINGGGRLVGEGDTGISPGLGIGGILTAQGPEPKVNANGTNAASGGDAGGKDEESAPQQTRAEKLEKIRRDLVEYAKSYTRRKLRYSMERRNEPGYDDCSSFVTDVYARFGYKIGPTTVQLWRQGVPVSLKELQPGDVLLSGSRSQGGGAAHTGIYIGGNQYIDVNTRRGDRAAQIKSMSYRRWDGARRIIGAKGMRNAKYKELTDGELRNGGRSTSGTGSDASTGSSSATSSGGTRYGIIGGSVGGGSMGLGSPNAAAYSTSELAALTAILSGGGGGGGILLEGSGGESGEESEETGGTGEESAESAGTGEGGADASGDKKRSSGVQKGVVEGKFRRDRNAQPRDARTAKEGAKWGAGGRWTLNYAPEKHPNPNVKANQDYARRMAKSRYGWGDEEFQALVKLWNKESGWNQYADNPASDAYGIAQALPPWKMASKGKDWRTNPHTQIDWGLEYIKQRYGSPSKALSWHLGHNWYAKGAWEIEQDEVAVVHKGEMIIPAQQARTIRDAIVEETGKKGGSTEPTFTREDGGMTVNLNFQPGSIVLNAGGGAQAGRSLAQQFIRELEKKELLARIARGEGKTFGPVSQ